MKTCFWFELKSNRKERQAELWDDDGSRDPPLRRRRQSWPSNATTTTAVVALHYDDDGKQRRIEKNGLQQKRKHVQSKTCFWLMFKAYARKLHTPGCIGKHISVKAHRNFTNKKSVAPTLHGDQNQGSAAKQWKRTDSWQLQNQQYHTFWHLKLI